jgi:hypothetical protein
MELREYILLFTLSHGELSVQANSSIHKRNVPDLLHQLSEPGKREVTLVYCEYLLSAHILQIRPDSV